MLKDYQKLGIKIGSTWEEIQKAYRQQMKNYHPDVNSHIENAENTTKELNSSFTRLKIFHDNVNQKHKKVKASLGNAYRMVN